MDDGFDSAPSLGSLSPFILSVVLLNIRGGGRSGGGREKSLVLNGEGRGVFYWFWVLFRIWKRFPRQWQMRECARDDLPPCRDLRHRRRSADCFHVSPDFHLASISIYSHGNLVYIMLCYVSMRLNFLTLIPLQLVTPMAQNPQSDGSSPGISM